MKYIVKVARNTITGAITVSPPIAAPDSVKPYHSGSGRAMKKKTGLVEVVQVYNRRRDALRAYRFETEAAGLSLVDSQQPKKVFDETVKHLKERYGLSLPMLAKLLKVSSHTLYSYSYGTVVPRPRLVVKIRALCNGFDAVTKSVSKLLPEKYATGNPQMSRGGRKDIWHDSPTVAKSLQRAVSKATTPVNG